MAVARVGRTVERSRPCNFAGAAADTRVGLEAAVHLRGALGMSSSAPKAKAAKPKKKKRVAPDESKQAWADEGGRKPRGNTGPKKKYSAPPSPRSDRTASDEEEQQQTTKLALRASRLRSALPRALATA